MPVTADSSKAPERRSEAEERARRTYRNATSSAVGLEMGVSVLIGLFFGWWLDGKLGTFPVMMIVFLGLGFAAGIRSLLRGTRSMMDSADVAAEKNSGDDASKGGTP
jgi:F0F1-type ATP synthase assembly protein I